METLLHILPAAAARPGEASPGLRPGPQQMPMLPLTALLDRTV
jgi:hypothetical protein